MDYQKAASYWVEKDAQSVPMERGALLAEMEKFIKAHNTCALATGYGEFVRCTPIEYSYMDKKFWLLSEGGLKFRALANNKRVCLAIFDSYSGFATLGGMQVTGKAEMIKPWSKEYLELLRFRNMQPESLKKLPQTLHLICITPTEIDFLWSGFKKLGVDTRQHITL